MFLVTSKSSACKSTEKSLEVKGIGVNFAPALSIKTLYSGKYGVSTAISSQGFSVKAFITPQSDAAAPQVKITPSSSDFSVDLQALDLLVTKNTKAIIINNPNNPSGKVYSKEEITAIAKILAKKQEEYNHPIFVIADEPYREILFDGEELTQIADVYRNTIICYSYSKSLSLPGERIGYIAIPNEICLFSDLYAGFLGALRSVGYVCAPSIFQYVVENFKPIFSDFSIYENNKNILIKGLTDLGFSCNNPKGAFYLMVKAPDGNAKEMSEKAKILGLLIVPASSFGADGYVRLATCVSTQTATKAVELFKLLAKEYNM